MSSTPSHELDLPRVYHQLASNLPQVEDLSSLSQFCHTFLDLVLPDVSYELVWDVDSTPQVLDTRYGPLLASPTIYQREQLQQGEIVDLGAGSACWVPLRLRGRLRGWLHLAPAGLEADQHAALGVLGVALAPLIADLDPDLAARRRIAQLRTLNDIAQVMSGAVQIDDLATTVYQSTCRVINAPIFYLALYDELAQHMRLLYAVDDGQHAALYQHWPANSGLVGVVLKERIGLRTNAYLDECRRRGVTPVGLNNESCNHAWMCVPILAHDQVLGVIVVSSDRADQHYSDEDLELLQTIAAHTSIAIANARLHERAARRARQLDLFNLIGRSITSTLDSEQVPALIMQPILELLDAEEGSLMLLDEQSGDLEFAFAGGPAGNQLIGQRVPRGAGIAGYVFSTARSVIVNNAREDGRFYAATDDRTGFTTNKILAAPLRGIAGVQGVIEVINKRGGEFFTEEDRRLIEAAADQAVIALENAQRFAKIDQALTQRARELDRTNSQLREILQVGNALHVEHHLDEVLWQVAQAISRSTGFRSAVIGLVQHSQSDTPYLQRAASSDRAVVHGRARVPLDAFMSLLRPEFQRGPATYLIDHRVVDYVDLWNSGDERSSADDAPSAPDDWDPRDILLTVLVDNTKKLLGFLRVQDPVDHKLPTAEQVQIIEIFANQAAVTIENVRLYENQAHGLRSLTALNGLGMAINTLVQSEEEIFSMTARGVMEMSDALGACVLLNEERDADAAPMLAIDPLVRIGPFPPHYEGMRELAARTLLSNRPETLAISAHQNDRLSNGPQALVAVPLRAAHKTLGVLCIVYSETLPPPADLEMLTLFAGQAAAAVANLRLWRDVNRGHDQLSSVTASIREGIVLIDPRGRMAVINSAVYRLCGINQDLEQQPLAAFLESWAATSNYPEGEWQLLHEGLEAIANNEEEIVHGELNQLTPRARSLEWAALAAHGTGASDEGMLLVLRDITDAKEAERLRQDLTNMIVHDMRSPLTSVMTSIDMLFKTSSGELNETQRAVLNIAYNGSQQMLEMVNLLLDISRLESKRMPLNRTPQPLGPLIGRATSRLLPQARNREIAIQTDIAKSLPLAYADGELIVRVLQNLIDNALKFSGRSSTIVVRATIEEAQEPLAQPVGDDALPLGNATMLQGDINEPMFLIHPNRVIKIAVSDRGVGIAPKDQVKIFDKFGQVGERRGGSGLGLTFCKLVAEAHGGSIGVFSLPNQGSTFFFTLPIVVVEG